MWAAGEGALGLGRFEGGDLVRSKLCVCVGGGGGGHGIHSNCSALLRAVKVMGCQSLCT